MTVQTFNPEKVLVSEKKDGTFTKKMTDIIMKDVAENSVVMQLGQYHEMDGLQEKTVYVQTDGVSAYWVNETEKIKTDKPEVVPVSLKAHKLGIILVASREALNYTWEKFFEDMKPQIVEAFYTKIDEAGLLGHETPFANSVAKSAKDSSQVVVGPINYENLLKLEDKLYEADINPNAFVSKIQNRSALRESRDGDKKTIYDKANNTIDGITTVDLKSKQFKKGDLLAGDFNSLIYGVPYNINFKISEEGQISTMKNQDGTPINLFEQEMVAVRVTMDIAVMVTKANAFAKLTASAENV
ncbi:MULTISPECIES: phage major capsid protein [unclassified Streptococcus]|jgi:phage capsid family|uniref:phage major capsid protein n=1 Tax=unclassified Streptococcus TaxID=2608887 RepID=UPI001021D087|nr:MULTISPECIES: phage major capsid protein [unclassified Streptococcus]MTQ41170.1 phage major capsid protein [Streptococcus sp. BIOML-A1]RYS60445.1 phage major capsid protein [Streptococcus sp. bf_0095]DAO60622.1 MAG TPA: Major capsid protein [Caudoviricetes sp.]